MFTSISAILSDLATAARAAKAIAELLIGKRGDVRALIKEVKHNVTVCWLVLEFGEAPLDVVPKLTTTEYDRLLVTNFNFNELQGKKIRKTPRLAKSDLSHFIGEQTSELVENIYDLIAEIKLLQQAVPTNPRIRWKVRINNIQKRQLLLIRHLKR